jgi:hypothetical protein
MMKLKNDERKMLIMANKQVVKVEELTVVQLRKVASELQLAGRSKWNKEQLIENIRKALVAEVVVEDNKLVPVVMEVGAEMNRTKVKTTREAFKAMVEIATEMGVANAYRVIDEVSAHLRSGAKLGQLIANPEKYEVAVRWVPIFRRFASIYDLRTVSIPVRESVAAIQVVLRHGQVDEAVGKVRVKGEIVRQSQSHLSDVIGKSYDWFKSVGNGTLVRSTKHDPEAKRMRDMTNIVYVDANMPLEEGQTELTDTQKQLQFVAMNGGIIVEVEGKEIHAEYLYQTPSQQRLVQATFCAEMDPIEVLERLGHDFRCYAKKAANGKWVIDMSKAIKRFGLSGTNTIPSMLVKIGNRIKKMSNGDIMLVGGTHTFRVTRGVHARVKTGVYKAYDVTTGQFRTIDASEFPRLLAVGDGLIFCDVTVYNALVAEFGLDTSAWQVRITPFTKGLMVFVPFLKDIYEADIVAFDTAVKGNYETLLEKHPDFEIEVRIALFNKPARYAKKYTNIPYQFINTLPLDHKAYIGMVDKHLDRAFELYENPKLMAEYLGLNVLSELESLSDEELTEEQRELAKNTLVSRFTEFLYAGEFTMKDPMMKKYAIDIIQNIIKEWSYGSVPVEGHYRFMVQDPYAILEAKRQYDRLEKMGVEEHDFKYIDENGDEYIIVPEYVGLPANTVFMIDDNDKFMMDGQDVVFNRNPKITYGETALARTYVTEEYALAHQAFKKAFVNLAIFSVHDFNTFKQGGADNDGDTTFAMTESAIVNAVKENIHRFPALLDISILEDGTFKEGCPFSNPNMDKNEFKRAFMDHEYTREFARSLHELSKVYVLRTLEPNDIGLLTNYATKILDAITKLTIAISEKVTLEGQPLTLEMDYVYRKEIRRYRHYVDILRLAQGWEIDKAKHGGYYKQFMDLRFFKDENYFPFYATKVTKRGNRVWFTPDWMAARKGMKGEKTGSLIQRIRDHVLARFENEIVEKFRALNPVSSENNLVAELSLAIQKPHHYDDVLKAVRQVRNEYTRGILKAVQFRDENFAKLEQYTVHADGRKVTEAEKAHYATIIEKKFSEMMDAVVEVSNARMSALEIELNVHPAVLGLAAYEITYADRNDKKYDSPTSGLSFPWAGAKYHLLSAVRLVSGKDMRFTNIQKVNASGVKINIGNLFVDPEWIKQNALAKGKIYVWNQPVADVNDPLHGYHVFAAYIGKVKIGYVFANKAHAFSGHDKWEVRIKDATYKVNDKTGRVHTVTFELDMVEPFIKH